MHPPTHPIRYLALAKPEETKPRQARFIPSQPAQEGRRKERKRKKGKQSERSMPDVGSVKGEARGDEMRPWIW